MNAETVHSSLFQSMLDGTLDPGEEQAVLDLLASDAAARMEFAKLAQLHAWLSADEKTRALLTAPAPERRRVVPHPAWWLAAAVAAAVIFFAASRLWPMPGGPVPITSKKEPVRPVIALQAACFNCHGDMDGAALLPQTGKQ
ncbi:MAG TPA: hypothetical protein VG796_00505 [Verrucomicrobiales bacterium]|jgi:ferric-dicitrate binding protein FerR (iron transport regulator)|nr:hypothetical protein [Verrucomicrobiales bacterium]